MIEEGASEGRIVENKGNVRIRNMLASIERTFLPVGSRIGKYSVIEEIDRGGMAVVYKALQHDLDRVVALKVMPANITINRQFVERFLTEAHAVAKLNHPNIVNIHEVAVENNIYYLAMDYIPGQNLYYHLHYNKPKLVDVLEIISRLADALQYAHNQKIIHRDLKLNNVIMKDRLTPVLIDFGLAKALEDDNSSGGITRTGEIMGSPSYMAPERILGGVVDHRSDICSLGIMLYEMLTFKNPYLDQRNLHQTTMNVIEATPIPPRKLVPWLPAEIEAITLKAMAKSAEDRYQSMDALRADINRYQRGDPVEAKPPSIGVRVRHFIKRHWPHIIIGGLVFLFTGLIALMMYDQSRREQSHWQLVCSEKFNSSDNYEDWIFTADPLQRDSAWRIVDGALHGRSAGQAFAQLQRRFNRDILVECDISTDSMDLFNAGIFLFGAIPDSGYQFYLNRDGNGGHGIVFPGSRFLFQDIEPSRIPLARVNHIVIERIQHAITFTINGVTVARVWDFLPPLGKGHEHVGFFVNGGSAVFDNMKIYRRAIPQAPSPTLIADRFVERGDMEAALDEYRGLLVDFADADITAELRIKMADCLVRMRRFDEALAMLEMTVGSKNKDETLVARRCFLIGIINNIKNENARADSVLRYLAVRFPTSPVNVSAMTTLLLGAHKTMESGDPGSAYREIVNMAEHYKRYPYQWGRLHLELLATYIKSGKFDSAMTISNDIMEHYSRDDDFAAAAKIAQGMIYLHRGRKEEAVELFDRSITAHINSGNVWEAWMALADIYRYDFRYKDAFTIYRKIHREAPPASIYHWLSVVDAADLKGQQEVSVRDSLLQTVIHGEHPFPLPRLIARFYLDSIRESDFREQWSEIAPDDRSYLFYLARKAIMNNEHIVAAIYLNDLRRNVPKLRWEYFKATRMLNNKNNW